MSGPSYPAPEPGTPRPKVSQELWEHKWQMQFNADKCEVPWITNKGNPTICNYRVHDQHLQTVKQAKYLGATISSDLSWNQHVDNTVKKATNTLNFLRRNIRDCPPRVNEQCYKTLVRPIMEYASCVWDPNTNTNINKLEMVQRRAARFVKGDYDMTSSVTTIPNELGWDTLQERRQHAKATMFYRIQLFHTILWNSQNYHPEVLWMTR